MLGTRINWVGLFALVLAIPPAARAWQQTPPVAAHAAVIRQYCAGCHNDKLKTADVSFTTADLGRVADNPGLWEKALRKVRTSQMPPAGLPKPSAEARQALVNYLETELDHAAAVHPDPGRPTIHRLNRAEYSNAIRDLLALDVKPGENLPPDDSGYGFDNIGDVLSMSPVLVERYLSVARQVARLAIGDTDVKPVIDVFDALGEVRTGAKGQRGRNDRLGEDLPFDSVGGLSFRYTFPVDGEYVFTVKMARPNSGFGETAPPVGQVFELRVPVKAGVRPVGLTFMRSDALAETLPGAGRGGGGGGRGGGAAAPITHLDLRLDGARLKLYDVPEGQRGREINEMSIAGPYNITGSGDSPSRQRIFICKAASPAEEDPCARKILSTLGRRAFRRPFTTADLTPLMAFYQEGRKDGGFEQGIEMALRAMLVSPDFLFRIERDPASAAAGSVYRVNDFELASRLSFFLWSSMPDDELLTVAEHGKLKDPKLFEQQVARMIDDPKSKAFTQNFCGQWLLLRNIDQIKPDVEQFPAFDESLRRAFRQETEMLFNYILRQNRPVTEILDANYTFLNDRLAEFYGIPGVYGSRFRRVELSDPNRGGLLGQGSILTATSYPTRTSVVLRGKWILENLLGAPPPPPPPDVPALELHGKGRQLSMREAMESHRANPVCASCHARMDPIGFALENYDGIGEWRKTDNGVTIDASGKLPDGAQFVGPAGLKKLLLTQHRDEFLDTFTEKLMTYALGRGVEPTDMPALRAVVREAEKQNVTVPALIDAIVESPQFQMRKTRQP
jgi:mono/diheme cytochrome c family protein